MTIPSIDAIKHVEQHCSGSAMVEIKPIRWAQLLRQALNTSHMKKEDLDAINKEAKKIVDDSAVRTEKLKKDLEANRRKV